MVPEVEGSSPSSHPIDHEGRRGNPGPLFAGYGWRTATRNSDFIAEVATSFLLSP